MVKFCVDSLEGRTLADTYSSKYIDVSAILNHRVDELLAGVLKQVRLRRATSANPDTTHGSPLSPAGRSRSFPRRWSSRWRTDVALYLGNSTVVVLVLRTVLLVGGFRDHVVLEKRYRSCT